MMVLVSMCLTHEVVTVNAMVPDHVAQLEDVSAVVVVG
jgi:hypothetical protein